MEFLLLILKIIIFLYRAYICSSIKEIYLKKKEENQKMTAPGWARTTNLSVNSRTR